MYQTVVKTESGGDIAISYRQTKITSVEQKVLKKYGIKVVTSRKLK